jgi:hypothetical protein
MKRLISIMFFLITMFVIQCFVISAQDAPVRIQGSLRDAGLPANGAYDIKCTFFSVETGGSVVDIFNAPSVPVTNGLFVVSVDNGSGMFSTPLSALWVEYSVRPGGSSGAYTILAPRQRVSFAPFAISSLELGGVSASQYVRTNDPRLTDARNPLAGSANYIQNSTVAQPNSNFNIVGNGTVGGILSATVVNVTGGITAGSIDVSSTVGFRMGGVIALSMANNNTSVGNQAGLLNSGTGNSFFGQTAGRQSFTGNNNSFFGGGAGYLNEAGNENSFFGYLSGNNSQGSRNSFFGFRAGLANGAGNSNTLVGYESQSFGAIANATAIGANSLVTQSNSLVLGSINGVNGATADTNVGIGTTTPANKLHVNGTVRVTNGGIYITNPNTVVITSPNGACWGITVNNSGALATFPVNPCP